MKTREKISYVFLLILSVIISGVIIITNEKTYSASCSLSISGETLNVGDTKKITIKSSSNTSSADGYIKSSDPSCIQIVSVNSPIGKNTDSYFAVIDQAGDGLSSVGSVTVKALKADCSATLKITGVSMSDVNLASYSGLSFTSGTIKVRPVQTTTQAITQPQNNQPSNPQPSNNNNTNNSTPANKTGSGNNLLSSLKVAGCNLNEKFNAKYTNYSINVDSTIKSVDVKADTQDDKAKVNISGNNQLKSGINKITITVTAENGSKKTYTITVNKEKDPNEPEEEQQPQEDVKGEEVEQPENIEVDDKSNTFLKTIIVKNGELNKKFNKYEHVYYFDSKYSSLFIENAIPEIETNVVKINRVQNNTIISVENDLGDKSYYLIIEKDITKRIIFYIILAISIILNICAIAYIIIKNKSPKNKK